MRNTIFKVAGAAWYVLILIFPGQRIFSQDVEKTQEMIPVTEIFSQLEELHSVKIFFNEEWFTNDSVSSRLLSSGLEEAMELILLPRKMEAELINGNLVVLPALENILPDEARADEYQVIGNPNEFGKSTSAVITGKVVDLLTKEPLIGVIVHAEGLGKGTTTDANGEYSLELPVGEHQLSVSYMGYLTDKKQIMLVSSGQLNTVLVEDSRLIDEVTIYAERADANISSTRMSLIRIDSKALYRLPTSMGEKDVIKSLTLLPGVQTIGEFGTGFHVRGGSADQNLILVEGVPLFNSSHLFGLTSLVNPDLVNNVTLIKGGIPAKYGERSSSVMDIRLSGKDIDQFSVSGGIGLLNSRLSLQTPLPVNNGYIIIGGRSSYSDWLLNKMPDKDLMNSSAQFYDMNGLIYLPFNERNNITVFGHYSHDGFGFSDEVNYEYASRLGSVRWNSIISEKIQSTLLLSHSDYNYNMTDSSMLNMSNSFRLESGINYNSLKWNVNFYPNPDITVEAGFDGINYMIEPGTRYPSGAYSTISELKLDTENAIEAAGYLTGSFNISPSLTSELGFRYTRYYRLGPGINRIYEENQPLSVLTLNESVNFDRNEIMAQYSGLEPRLSLRYQINEAASIKMNYYRVNQYINLVSNTSLPAPADVWYLSNIHRRPMKTDQIALGYFRNYQDNGIEASLEVYYKNMDDIPEPGNNARIVLSPALETQLVSTRGYSYGAELYVKKSVGKYNGWISYTLSRSERRTDTEFKNDQINSNEYFPASFDKPHNLIVNADIQLKRRWRAGATFSYNTGRPVTLPELTFIHDDGILVYFSDRNKYRLPDYHRLDLSISFDGSLRLSKKWRGSWTVSVVNVYGRKNIYSTFYEKTVPSAKTNYQNYSLYKMYIIGRPLPTLTYNFTF